MRTVFRTVSGVNVDLLAPDWRDFDLAEIAAALSEIHRYAGHALRQVSVAQHSLVVGALVDPRWRLPALLHDAHEAFLGDWTRPGIEALVARGGDAVRSAILRVRRPLDVALARAVLEASGAVCVHGLAAEAMALADRMTSAEVAAADEQAFRLEDAIRGDPNHSTLFEIARPGERYGQSAQTPDFIAEQWLAAVRTATVAAYEESWP